MKKINDVTFESDADKVFENINTKERTWGVCLGVDDSMENWPEVPATEDEMAKREEIHVRYIERNRPASNIPPHKEK